MLEFLKQFIQNGEKKVKTHKKKSFFSVWKKSSYYDVFFELRVTCGPYNRPPDYLRIRDQIDLNDIWFQAAVYVRTS